MELTLRKCTMDDLHILREFSYKTFSDTFRHMNTPANIEAYLERAFNINKLRDELLNSSSMFYFLYADEKLAAYLKLNEYQAQTDFNDPQSIEVERIYVDKEHHGKGLGSMLINKAVDIANIKRKSYIWLGVWEKNDKALMFYKRNGFYLIGKHSFLLGEEEQTDFILRKDL